MVDRDSIRSIARSENETGDIVQQVADTAEVLQGTGGGLGVDHAQHFGLGMGRNGFGELFQRERFSPGDFDGMDGRAATLHIIFHAAAENPVDHHDRFVAGFQQVDQNRLHPGHSGSGDGKGERVLGAVDLPNHLAGLIHVPDVLGIEVPECGSGDRLQNTRRHGAGAGPHEQSLSRMKWRDHLGY